MRSGIRCLGPLGGSLSPIPIKGLLRLLLTLACFFLLSAPARAQTPTDSLLSILPRATGTERVDLLNQIAGTLARQAPDRSLAFSDSARQEADSLDYPLGRGTALYWRGLARYALDRYEDAVANYLSSLEVLEESRTGADILGYVYNHLGNAYNRLLRHSEAVDAYRRATRAHEAAGDTTGWAFAHNNLGLLYWRTSRYSSALTQYRHALELREAMADSAGISALLNNMGVIHYQQGAYESALEHYLRSLELRTALGNERGAALVLNNIGKTYQDWGQLDEALASFRGGLTRSRRADDASALGYSLNNIGTIHEARGDLEGAREHYQRSLEVYSEAGLDDGVVLNLISLGRLHHLQGNDTGALPLLDEAVALARQAGNREREARGLAYRGLALAGVGRSAEGLRALNAALDTAEEVGQRQLYNDIQGFLADVHAGREEFGEALAYERAYIALKDSLFDESSGRRIAAMRASREAESRAQENALLRSMQTAQEAVIARQRQGFALGGILLLLAAALAVVLYRAQASARASNQLLAEANLALENKNEALAEALERVRTLRGLIPICANCKKIRDDEGFWEQVETYVSKHSEASFSHGICPDCALELYSEVDGVAESDEERQETLKPSRP